jgi:adenylyltransferase/sulfurtransferase
VLGILPGTIGTIQATEAIKLIIGIGRPLIGRLLLYDALEMIMDEVRLHKNTDCVICGQNPTVTKLIDYEEFCGMPMNDREDDETGRADWDITVQELHAKLASGDHFRLIDVREDFEWDIVHINEAELIPMGKLPSHMSEFDSTDEYVMMCRTGARSAQMVQLLASAGISRVKNLKGGIRAWAQEIDTNLPIY